MAIASQLNPGMTVSVDGELYRVESSVKVATGKANPFIKAKLRGVFNDEVVEKNFKPNQQVDEVALAERTLEYLYLEGKEYVFLDVDELEMVRISPEVVGEMINFLKEGTQISATLYGTTVSSLELPAFLELMVATTEEAEPSTVPMTNVSKIAVLETGARVEVPPFVEAGDIIKVARTGEYIQRV